MAMRQGVGMPIPIRGTSVLSSSRPEPGPNDGAPGMAEYETAWSDRSERTALRPIACRRAGESQRVTAPVTRLRTAITAIRQRTTKAANSLRVKMRRSASRRVTMKRTLMGA